jgi:hypothetical protein
MYQGFERGLPNHFVKRVSSSPSTKVPTTESWIVVAKVIGVETVDHPSDGQLVAYARKYLHARAQML